MPASVLAAGAVFVLLMSSCRPAPPDIRYDDLVTEGSGSEQAWREPPEQRFCGDETRFARRLESGRELQFWLTLGDDPRLVLDFCSRSPRGGELAVAVQGQEGAGLTRTFEVGGGQGWQHHEVPLADFPTGQTSFTVRPDLPDGASVFLRDLFVAHRDVEPAVWSLEGVSVDGARWDGAEERPSPRSVRADNLFEGAALGPPAQILLISLDTLRVDAVGALGGAQDTPSDTPALDRLALDGEIFQPHYTASSWTLPSHASMLTGYPVPVHGATEEQHPIQPYVSTLAERMRDAGLATGAIVYDCEWLNPAFGFHRGFDDYRSVRWGAGQAVRAAVNWIGSRRDGAFFFFLHAFDSHSDFRRLPYEGRGATRASVRERFGVPSYGCREGHCASGLLRSILDGELDPLPGEDAILRHLYRTGVRELDGEIGRLLEDLKKLGLYDQMMIVVTSDHGEMLLEHGDTLHGQPWEEVLQVPLIVKWPRGERAGRTTAVPTSAFDLAPTLLTLAGAAPDDLPGHDLREPPRDRPIMINAGWWAIRHRGRKAIFLPGEIEEGWQGLLFDLRSDPGEEHDLAALRPRVLEALEALGRREAAGYETLRRRLERASPETGGEVRPLSEESRRRLRALGYLE